MKKLPGRIIRILGVLLGAATLLIVAFAAYVQLRWNRPVDRPVIAMKAPADAARILRGQYLYERSLLCWDCHGSKGGRNLDDEALGTFIAEGPSGSTMPGFGKTLTREQIKDVIAFIRSW